MHSPCAYYNCVIGLFIDGEEPYSSPCTTTASPSHERGRGGLVHRMQSHERGRGGLVHHMQEVVSTSLQQNAMQCTQHMKKMRNLQYHHQPSGCVPCCQHTPTGQQWLNLPSTTVEPLYRGHHWDPAGCPVYSGTSL